MELTPATVRMMIIITERDPDDERYYPWTLRVGSRLSATTVRATIAQFVAAGWLSEHWQSPEEAFGGNSPCRYYRVTEAGRQDMLVHLSRARQDGRFEDLFPPSRPTSE